VFKGGRFTEASSTDLEKGYDDFNNSISHCWAPAFPLL